MNKMVIKFGSTDGARLSIFARPSKRGNGVNVAATMKPVGQPAQTGCRASFETDAEAKSAVDALKADAVKNGWTPIEKRSKRAFTRIPAAPRSRNGKKSAA